MQKEQKVVLVCNDTSSKRLFDTTKYKFLSHIWKVYLKILSSSSPAGDQLLDKI